VPLRRCGARIVASALRNRSACDACVAHRPRSRKRTTPRGACPAILPTPSPCDGSKGSVARRAVTSTLLPEPHRPSLHGIDARRRALRTGMESKPPQPCVEGLDLLVAFGVGAEEG